MATWQCDFHLVSRILAEREVGPDAAKINMEAFEALLNWRNAAQPKDLEVRLSGFLTRTRSWHSDLSIWGEDDGNRIDVLQRDGLVSGIFARVDLRHPSRDFVSQLVELAEGLDALFVDAGGVVLRPDVETMVDALKTSSAAKFVSDPVRFLKDLGDEGRDN